MKTLNDAAGVILVILALVAMFLGSIKEADAQSVCGDYEEITDKLEASYQEYRHGLGLAANGSVIEIRVSETQTFTIIIVRPDGLTCLMAAGENWEGIKKPTPGLGL